MRPSSSRNVVMIETTAIRIGRMASAEANTNSSTASAPSAAEHGLEQQPRALAVGAAVLDERVEAGQVHGLARHASSPSARRSPPSRPWGSRRTPSPGRAAGRRPRRWCGRRPRRRSCRRWRRRRPGASSAGPARARGRPSRGPRARSGSRRACPAAASPPGPAGRCRRPSRGSARAIATFVSQPSLLGTENSGSSASVAGPAAAMPAMVRTTQVSTTVRLCARTQRVSEDNGATSDVIACET